MISMCSWNGWKRAFIHKSVVCDCTRPTTLTLFTAQPLRTWMIRNTSNFLTCSRREDGQSYGRSWPPVLSRTQSTRSKVRTSPTNSSNNVCTLISAISNTIRNVFKRDQLAQPTHLSSLNHLSYHPPDSSTSVFCLFYYSLCAQGASELEVDFDGVLAAGDEDSSFESNFPSLHTKVRYLPTLYITYFEMVSVWNSGGRPSTTKSVIVYPVSLSLIQGSKPLKGFSLEKMIVSSWAQLDLAHF